MSACFTPDDELALVFPPSLVPSAVAQNLPHDFHIRPLSTTDRLRGHLDLLRALTQAPDLDEATYLEVVADMMVRGKRGGYYPVVVVNKETDQIVGTGTLLIERKFIRNAGLVGHIEDIAVSPSVQGRKLGLRIITALVGIGEQLGCYKTILDCNQDNVPFYQKCGFEQKEFEMAKYAPTPLPTAESLAALSQTLAEHAPAHL